jgi:hypothetical protein
MQPQGSAATTAGLRVEYEGFAEGGRIKLSVEESAATAAYERHPMVTSTMEPWTRSVALTPSDVEALFAAVDLEALARMQCPPLTMMPGQDVTVKHVSVAVGSASPVFTCDFVETPAGLVDLVARLEPLYAKVRDHGAPR